MERIFLLKKHYELQDIQSNEIIESNTSEYQVVEDEIRNEIENSVKEFQNIGDDKNDIYYKFNGEKSYMPDSIFFDFIKTAELDKLLKMEFVFLGFVGNTTVWEYANIPIKEITL